MSVQIPVSGRDSPGDTAEMNRTAFGDPILWNTAFQYHFMQYFWPELEVNYEYWPNGERGGLNQVLLTPGLIFGRFKIGQDTATRPINLIFGRISGGGDVKSGHQKQFRRHRADHLLAPA